VVLDTKLAKSPMTANLPRKGEISSSADWTYSATLSHLPVRGCLMGHDLVPSRQRRNAKSMRRVMTDAVLKLWNELRAHRLMGLSFRRQVPIGPYIVDFACPTHRIVVEIDGSQHAEAEQAEREETRSAYLKSSGWTILRFWNDDVIRDIDNVCQHIVIVAGLADAAMPASEPARESVL